MQLDATPKIEGVLKILGVKWKLSGLVGYRYFEPNTKKKHKKGKPVARNSSGRILSFIVIKVIVFYLAFNLLSPCFKR